MTKPIAFRHFKTSPEIICLAVMLSSHLLFRRRERAMLRFRRLRTLQKFASVHASVHAHFPMERHLQNCDT